MSSCQDVEIVVCVFGRNFGQSFIIIKILTLVKELGDAFKILLNWF